MIGTVTKAGGVSLSPSQQHALDTCLDAIQPIVYTEADEIEYGARGNRTKSDRKPGRFIFVTGKAGTGKSTILREIKAKRHVLTCAPTGLAALLVGGQTIHRLFGFRTGLAPKPNVNGQRKDILRAATALVIDEVSMVRSDMIDSIDKSLRRASECDLPFGGKTVIAIGDMWQLEPVGPTTPEEEAFFKANYKSTFWFDAHVFDRGRSLIDNEPTIDIETCELVDVFRQVGDPEFIDALNAIRLGDPAGLAFVNQRASLPVPGDMPVTLTFTKKKAAEINERRLRELPTVSKTYHGVMNGEWKSDEYPADEEITFKVGAQVMICKNIEGECGPLANGTVGEVLGFGVSGPVIALADGRLTEVGPAEWSKVSYKYNVETNEIDEDEDGLFSQVPLKLAWAITTHKSQGQTLENVYLELERTAFSHGQLYVALSRVKSLGGLFMRRRLLKDDLVVAKRVREFTGVGQTAAAPFDVEAQ